MLCYLSSLCLLTVIFTLISKIISNQSTIDQYNSKFPIVLVHLVSKKGCHRTLPIYIKYSIQQAIKTQIDCQIILISNFNECNDTLKAQLSSIKYLKLIDIDTISSNKTTKSLTYITKFFSHEEKDENIRKLWIYSAFRFFVLEDLIRKYDYKSVLHLEADNMLYVPIINLLPGLYRFYPSLAATILDARSTFITASVLWVPSLSAIETFNNFIITVLNNETDVFHDYTSWLKKHHCCKRGTNLVKPAALNEMSLIAYYYRTYPQQFMLFPILPTANYVTNRFTTNLTAYSVDGNKVGPMVGNSIWDSGSWGQNLGTHYNL